MATKLERDILKNLPMPQKSRVALEAWMDAIEAKLAELDDALDDVITQYEAHRVLTAGTVHGAADSTNAVTETTTLADPSH
jgi:hypothetical protein